MTDRPRPAPLTPPDLDLRSVPSMLMEVARLRQSSLALTSSAEAFRAAVLLWCVAWHQVPAGSLPDDDRELCAFAGLGRDLKLWESIRAEAMRGFVLCSDGRHYHKTVCEKAIRAGADRRLINEKMEKMRGAQKRRKPKAEANEINNLPITRGLANGLTSNCNYNSDSQIGSSIPHDSGANAPAVARRRTTGTTLPEGWTPSPDSIEYGHRLGLSDDQIESDAEEMRLWAKANANRQVARKADWNATFKNWMRNNRGRKPGGRPGGSPNGMNPPRPGGRGGPSYAEIAARGRK